MKARFVALVSFGLLTASAALADDVGTAITYQGELLDGGSPVGSPTPVDCEFQFTLWDMAVGGTQIGPALPTGAIVSNGRFTVPLDFGDDRFQGSRRFLQIEVCCPLSCAPAGLVPLNPRQELTPAPYALALPGLYTRQHPSSPNLIGGFSGNIVEDGAAASTIGGGGSAGAENRVLDSGGTIGGGSGNTAGSNDTNPATAQLATVGGGSNNEAIATNATVGGGNSNQASGQWSTIAGGWFNFAFDGLGTVGGGGNNTASGLYSTVGGGGGMNAAEGNTASGSAAFVGGGQSNAAGGDNATIAGGLNNQTSAVRATISGGRDNNVSAGSATIAGGSTNSVTDNFGTVGGGSGNRAGDNDADPATAAYATVAGGNANIAEGFASTIAGGQSNLAAQFAATVGGGLGNHAAAYLSTVAGGDTNTASGPTSTVGGGAYNVAQGTISTVSGGENNSAQVDFATIGGGSANIVTGTWGTISGGESNNATASHTSVGGGFFNEAVQDWATIAGGDSNSASGFASTVPGGHRNRAIGDFSFAAGQRAQALHPSSFVWSDSTTVSPNFFTSTAGNQFLINAAGGVGIGTNAPAEKLDVDGNIRASGTLRSGNSITIDGITNTISSTSGAISFDNENLATSGIIESTVAGFKFPDGTLQTTAATGGGGGFWSASGADIFNSNAGDVGIGLSNPLEKLDVDGMGQFRQGLAVFANPGTFDSDCCSFHGGAGGCDNPTCESAVCAAEATCCTFGAWTITCGDLARDLCETICDPVFLPTNSISARERTPITFDELPPNSPNEPGVAGTSQNGLFGWNPIALTGGVDELLVRSIDPPTSGWVLVIGTLGLRVDHTRGTPSRAVFGVSDSSTAFPTGHTLEVQIPLFGTSDFSRQVITVHGIFPVTGVEQTFSLLGQGDGNFTVENRQLTLVFFQTAYGTVTAPSPTSRTAGNEGDSETESMNDQDRLAAFDAGRLAFEDELGQVTAPQPMSPADIERELADLRARMEDRMTMLEQQLADLGQTGGEEE